MASLRPFVKFLNNLRSPSEPVKIKSSFLKKAFEEGFIEQPKHVLSADLKETLLYVPPEVKTFKYVEPIAASEFYIKYGYLSSYDNGNEEK